MIKPKITGGKIVFIIILLIIGVISLPNQKKARPNIWAGISGCHYDISLITNAIEFYNMDSKIMIEELNKENIDLLFNGKYLKNKDGYWPHIKEGWGSRDKCDYKIKGNLSKDGLIYCEYHGSRYGLENPNRVPPSNEYLRDERSKKIKKYISDFAFPVICLITIIVTIFI